MPEGAEEGIVKGMYLFKKAPDGTPKDKRVTLMGSGAILREVIAGRSCWKRISASTPTSGA